MCRLYKSNLQCALFVEDTKTWGIQDFAVIANQRHWQLLLTTANQTCGQGNFCWFLGLTKAMLHSDPTRSNQGTRVWNTSSFNAVAVFVSDIWRGNRGGHHHPWLHWTRCTHFAVEHHDPTPIVWGGPWGECSVVLPKKNLENHLFLACKWRENHEKTWKLPTFGPSSLDVYRSSSLKMGGSSKWLYFYTSVDPLRPKEACDYTGLDRNRILLIPYHLT